MYPNETPGHGDFEHANDIDRGAAEGETPNFGGSMPFVKGGGMHEEPGAFESGFSTSEDNALDAELEREMREAEHQAEMEAQEMERWAELEALSVHLPDQGIFNGFHEEHVGQGVFTAYRLDNVHPDPSQALHHHDLSGPLKVRIFLPQSLHNIRVDMHDLEHFRPGRAKIKLRLLLNGHEETWQTFTITLADQLETWTTWWYNIVREQPSPWDLSDDPVEQSFARVMERTGPGRHHLELEWRMMPDYGSDEEDGELLVHAQLDLEFNESQHAAWRYRNGARNPQPIQRQAQPQTASSFRVTIQNDCQHDIPYQIVSGATTSNSTLGHQSGTLKTLYPGDRILVNGNTIFTAGPGSEGQKVYLCR